MDIQGGAGMVHMDYTKLAEHADYLMIMSYDEHYETGNPGPIASLGFVEKSINMH